MSKIEELEGTFRELLGELRELRNEIAGETAALSNLKANVVNQVLFSGTVQFPAANAGETVTPVFLEYAAISGSVFVDNHTAATITIVDGPAAGSAPPTKGVGVHLCRNLNAGSYAISSRQGITLFGTPLGYADVQISSAIQSINGAA